MRSTGISEGPPDDGKEMLEELKEKFKMITNSSKKLQLLTVLPKSWSVRRIEQEFHVSNYMGQKSKKVVQEKGILSFPNPRSGSYLPQQTRSLVQQLYLSDEVSRVIAGRKTMFL